MTGAGFHDPESDSHVDRLSIFREKVGITDVLPSDTKSDTRAARNVGIYKRVVTAEKNARLQYYAIASLINVCLLVQLVVAAVLTALGAANASHTAITALGALNTVVAGLLSFTKGQGLPNRLKQYQGVMRKVRENIEQRERDFAQPDCELDLHDEIKTAIFMYQEAWNNNEANDPNAYHKPTEVVATANPVYKAFNPPARSHRSPETPAFRSALGRAAGSSESSDSSAEREWPLKDKGKAMQSDNPVPH